ncbi:MAG: phage tail protein [Myxococcales bacterium]|nr:phage tail protein [Myxococcales bacterium]
MASATTRRKAGKLVAPEASQAFGTMQPLPAAAPTIVVPDTATPVAAAMMAEQKVSAGGDSWGAAGSSKGAVSDLASELKSALAMGGKQTSGSSDRPGDPDLAYAFKLMIGGVAYATFSEVGGMSWKAEAIPVRSGGNNEHGYHMRGPGKFEPLTLKRGQFAANGEFYDMMKSSLSGNSKGKGAGAERLNITITLLNRKYQPIGEYQLFKAFITEYSGLSLNAMSSQVGFEQIRLAYDYFEYKSL